MALRLSDLRFNTPKKKRASALKYQVDWHGCKFRLTEEGMCSLAFAEWLRAHRIKFLHIPNEGKRHPLEGMAQKALGLNPSASDYLITSKIPNYPNVRGVFLEMKTLTGNVTEGQEEFINSQKEEDYMGTVCYGADDAIKFMQSLGFGGGK